MNTKQFVFYQMIINAFVGALVGYGVYIGSVILPTIALLVGLLFFYFGKKRVDEVLEDERVYRISDKSSRRTLEILTIGMAIVGVSLIALKRIEGYALAYAASIGVILYLFFYSYYNRKPLE